MIRYRVPQIEDFRSRLAAVRTYLDAAEGALVAALETAQAAGLNDPAVAQNILAERVPRVVGRASKKVLATARCAAALYNAMVPQTDKYRTMLTFRKAGTLETGTFRGKDSSLLLAWWDWDTRLLQVVTSQGEAYDYLEETDAGVVAHDLQEELGDMPAGLYVVELSIEAWVSYEGERSEDLEYSVRPLSDKEAEFIRANDSLGAVVYAWQEARPDWVCVDCEQAFSAHKGADLTCPDLGGEK